MRGHVDLLGVLFVLWGGFQLLIAAVLGLVFVGLGGGLAVLGVGVGGEDGVGMALAGGVYGVVGLLAMVVTGVMAVPSVLVGLGLRRRRAWARILAMVLGALSLTNMPLGTILGVYAFVVLLDAEVAAEFDASKER